MCCAFCLCCVEFFLCVFRSSWIRLNGVQTFPLWKTTCKSTTPYTLQWKNSWVVYRRRAPMRHTHTSTHTHAQTTHMHSCMHTSSWIVICVLSYRLMFLQTSRAVIRKPWPNWSTNIANYWSVCFKCVSLWIRIILVILGFTMNPIM